MQKIRFRGELVSLNQISQDHGIAPSTIYDRYRKGLRGLDLIANSKEQSHRFNIARNRKLSDEEVLEVRELALHGDMTQTEIGEMYGIGQHQVSRIKNLKRWSSL